MPATSRCAQRPALPEPSPLDVLHAVYIVLKEKAWGDVAVSHCLGTMQPLTGECHGGGEGVGQQVSHTEMLGSIT